MGTNTYSVTGMVLMIVTSALFQNCGKFAPTPASDQSFSQSSISTLDPNGTVTVTPPPSPSPSPAGGTPAPIGAAPPVVTVTSPLSSSSPMILADDNITLSSTLTTTAGTLTYRWFFTADDAQSTRLQAFLRANDLAKILDMVSAGQATSFAETTSRLILNRIRMNQTGTFHLAAYLGSEPGSVQSLKINVLEHIPELQSFTTPGTFTWRKPLRGTTATVECWGAGGSGGSGGFGTYFSVSNPASAGGGGGGGGGYSAATFNLSALNNTETVVIGRGGAAGASGPLNANGIYSNSVYILPGAAALIADGSPGEESVFGNRMVVASGGRPGTRSQGLTPGLGGAGGAGTSANGFSGSAGGIAGGNGDLAGGAKGTFGLGGENGTYVNSNGQPSSYHWSSGRSGFGGAGGGGGGGNTVGASGGGAGGSGSCLVTVK